MKETIFDHQEVIVEHIHPGIWKSE